MPNSQAVVHKARWQDAFLKLWDFGQSNKDCIYLCNKENWFLSLRFSMQCLHLHQLRFPFLNYVINWQLKRKYVSFFLIYHGSHYFFLFRFKLKWLKNGGAKVFIVTCHIFFRIITFFIKYKSDIVFSIFFYWIIIKWLKTFIYIVN